MKRYLKYSLQVLILYILLMLVIFNFTNVNFLKPYIGGYASDLLGRELILGGDIKLSLFPPVGVTVEGVKLKNLPWSENEYFIESELASVSLVLSALVVGDIEIESIRLKGVYLNFEKNNENEKNWVFDALTDDKEQKKGSAVSAVVLPFSADVEIALNDLSINYSGGGVNQQVFVSEMKLQGADTADIELRGLYNEIPVNLKLQTKPLKDVLNSDVLPLKLVGDFGGINFNVKADIGLTKNSPAEINLIYDIKMSDLETINQLIKQNIKLPGALSAAGKLIKNNDTIYLEVNKGTLGKTHFNGDIKYRRYGKVPDIDARLMIVDLDLNELEGGFLSGNIKNKGVPEKNIDASENNENPLFSNAHIPVKMFRILNADIDIKIIGVEHDFLEIEVIKLQARLKNGVLNVNRLYIENQSKEVLEANARLDAGGPGPLRLMSSLHIENIQLDKNDVLKKYVSGAKTDMEMNITSKGASVEELMGNLNGRLTVKVGKGVIKDDLLKFMGSNFIIDIVEAVNPIADKKNTTNLECAVVNLDIKDGVITSDKGIAMKTEKIQVVSSGVIDLKNETLEFGIRPQARKGVELNLNSLASMVKISGSVRSPDISMSLKDTAIVYSFFATGGATYLAKSLFDSATRDSSPCKTAARVAEKK
ncbi:hypothetical protein MNBD_GAMMA09-1121 [hydrothermal vent metagenome]|uniref:AsmA domain-containing protein n=1 Tax=hydrothermal vent metagenome TaxID=652676 RepID=A0A3B0X6A1_9ZZZZ